MTWTEAQRRASRREYERSYKALDGRRFDGPVHVPADVAVLDRDPSPCFRCESRDACRHRPWMLAS